MKQEGWEAVAEDMRRAKTARGRRQLGSFLVEGWRVISRALSAQAPIQQLLIGHSAMERPEGWAETLRARSAEAAIPITIAPDQVLRGLTEGRSFGDVVGLVALPESPTVSRLLDEGQEQNMVVRAVIAVDVLDPGNLGALMRTTLVSGASTLITVGGTDPYHPKAVRASMGSIFRLRLRHETELEATLSAAKAKGIETLAMVPQGGIPLPKLPPPVGPRALMVGGEAHGLPATAIAQANGQVTIPMAEQVDSYSINAATAIALYALREAMEGGGAPGCSEAM